MVSVYHLVRICYVTMGHKKQIDHIALLAHPAMTLEELDIRGRERQLLE